MTTGVIVVGPNQTPPLFSPTSMRCTYCRYTVLPVVLHVYFECLWLPPQPPKSSRWEVRNALLAAAAAFLSLSLLPVKH